VSNFCDKIFRGFRSTGVKVPDFPLTLLVIVTTVLRYRAACDENLKSNYKNYRVSVIDMPFEYVGQG